MSFLSSLLGSAKDLCFPPLCLSCGTKIPSSRPPLFCPSCAEKISLIRSPLCTICGQPFPSCAATDDHLCGSCLKKPFAFSRARAVVVYNATMKAVVQAFKYRGMLACLPTFAELFRQNSTLSSVSDFHYIIPVPLHVRRLRERGFNQALLIAQTLFPEKNAFIRHDLLERSLCTDPQTSLSGKERRKNLRGAFSVKENLSLREKNILLVDDVFTTGTTVNECARVLRRADAADVQVLTLARVE